MQLSVRDAARLLNVSEKTIYRWIKQQAIPAYRISGQIRFSRAELLEWGTARRIPLSPEIFAEAVVAKEPPPSLTEALRAGGVLYRVGGVDKPSVLKATVELLHLPDEVDRTYLYQVLAAREALGSTGIGDGIAIPHVRNPVVLHVAKPTVTLCLLENAVDYGAIDGRPVDTLFTLISPTMRSHLHLMARLGFVLRNPRLRDALNRRASREELMEAMRLAEATIPPPAEAVDRDRAPLAP